MKKTLWGLIIFVVFISLLLLGCSTGTEVTGNLSAVEASIESMNTYTVTFEPNGGVGRAFSQSFRGGQSQALLRCKFTRAGYSFMGWATSADGAVTYRNNNQLILKKDMTLYAVWGANHYTITFNANGGSGEMDVQSMAYDEAKNLTANSFSLTDYTFLGWSLMSSATTAIYENQESVSNLTATDGGEVILYAVWRYKNYHDAVSGNIVINGTEYANTSFIKVMNSEVTVDGTDDNWSNYLDSNAEARYKGVFIKNRNVKLSPYSMSQYLVTQELYEVVMSSTQSYSSNSIEEGKHPAYYVSWYDAITFCNKLSLLMGKEPCYTVSGIDDWAGLAYASIPTITDSDWDAVACDITKNGYRLPTEAEWEFAARGGDTTEPDWYYAFSGIQSLKQVYRGTTESDTDYGGTGNTLQKDDNLASVGWYTKNSTSKVHPVGRKTANRLGLYDMSGNLYEWCWDWYNDSVTSNDNKWKIDGIVTNPMGAASGSDRVLRGGRWSSPAYACCVSFRGYRSPNDRIYIGFRIACNGSGD